MVGKGRAVLAVVAGMVLWALLWNGGTAASMAAFPDLLQPDQPIQHVGMLWAYILYSGLVSLLAGLVTCTIARGWMRPVWILAFIHLAIGVGVQITFRDLMPLWYHLIFLALVVPAHLAGARLKSGGVVVNAGAV